MNLIPFVHIKGHKAGDSQYMVAGLPTQHPYSFYMGTGLVFLSPNMLASPHQLL